MQPALEPLAHHLRDVGEDHERGGVYRRDEALERRDLPTGQHHQKHLDGRAAVGPRRGDEGGRTLELRHDEARDLPVPGTDDQDLGAPVEDGFKSGLARVKFDDLKCRYDALFADMTRRMEEVREEASRDGGLLAGFAADERVSWSFRTIKTFFIALTFILFFYKVQQKTALRPSQVQVCSCLRRRFSKAL